MNARLAAGVHGLVEPRREGEGPTVAGARGWEWAPELGGLFVVDETTTYPGVRDRSVLVAELALVVTREAGDTFLLGANTYALYCLRGANAALEAVTLECRISHGNVFFQDAGRYGGVVFGSSPQPRVFVIPSYETTREAGWIFPLFKYA